MRGVAATAGLIFPEVQLEIGITCWFTRIFSTKIKDPWPKESPHEAGFISRCGGGGGRTRVR